MRKQYSFILTESELSEGKRLNRLAAILALGGSLVGGSKIPLPQAYANTHNDASTVGAAVVDNFLHPESHGVKKVNYGEAFTNGTRLARKYAFQMDPEAANVWKIGDRVTHPATNNVASNMNAVVHGEIHL